MLRINSFDKKHVWVLTCFLTRKKISLKIIENTFLYKETSFFCNLKIYEGVVVCLFLFFLVKRKSFIKQHVSLKNRAFESKIVDPTLAVFFISFRKSNRINMTSLWLFDSNKCGRSQQLFVFCQQCRPDRDQKWVTPMNLACSLQSITYRTCWALGTV